MRKHLLKNHNGHKAAKVLVSAICRIWSFNMGGSLSGLHPTHLTATLYNLIWSDNLARCDINVRTFHSTMEASGLCDGTKVAFLIPLGFRSVRHSEMGTWKLRN